MKYKRLNLFGPPNCGKSTLASGLYYKAKIKNYRVELVREVVKDRAYEGTKISIPSQQQSFFALQIEKEDLYLSNGIDFVVSDSPVLLPIIYSEYYNLKDYIPGMILNEQIHEDKYSSINFFLKRNSTEEEYIDSGRFQNFKEINKLNNMIYDGIKSKWRNFHEIDFNDIDKICEICEI